MVNNDNFNIPEIEDNLISVEASEIRIEGDQGINLWGNLNKFMVAFATFTLFALAIVANRAFGLNAKLSSVDSRPRVTQTVIRGRLPVLMSLSLANNEGFRIRSLLDVVVLSGLPLDEVENPELALSKVEIGDVASAMLDLGVERKTMYLNEARVPVQRAKRKTMCLNEARVPVQRAKRKTMCLNEARVPVQRAKRKVRSIGSIYHSIDMAEASQPPPPPESNQPSVEPNGTNEIVAPPEPNQPPPPPESNQPPPPPESNQPSVEPNGTNEIVAPLEPNQPPPDEIVPFNDHLLKNCKVCKNPCNQCTTNLFTYNEDCTSCTGRCPPRHFFHGVRPIPGKNYNVVGRLTEDDWQRIEESGATDQLVDEEWQMTQEPGATDDLVEIEAKIKLRRGRFKKLDWYEWKDGHRVWRRSNRLRGENSRAKRKNPHDAIATTQVATETNPSDQAGSSRMATETNPSDQAGSSRMAIETNPSEIATVQVATETNLEGNDLNSRSELNPTRDLTDPNGKRPMGS
jgi:hypothetical protein